MRDYGKVHTSFWTSADMRELSEDGRTMAIYLLTCPHGTIAGVFRLPDGYASEDLKWESERVKSTLSELLVKGFASRCEQTKWVCVTKHLDWNPPENPNQKKAVAKIISQVPDSCDWKAGFIGKYGAELGIEAKPLPNPSATLPEPVTVTVAVTGTVEPKGSLSPAKLTTSNCPTEKIIEIYHDVLPELPAVRIKTAGRDRAVKARWQWVLTSKKPDGTRRAETTDAGLEWFKNYFTRTRDNEFLMGQTPRTGDHKNWQCDFDFLLTEKGMKHVIEKTRETA